MVEINLTFMNDIFGENLYILPQAVLIVGALLIPALFFLTRKRCVCAIFAEIAVMLSGLVVAFSILDNRLFGTFMDLFKLDIFSATMMFLFLGVVFFVILISPASNEVTNHAGEYYSLLLVATAGMLFVAASNNLLAIFVGVECVSITSYALVAMKKNDPRSSEAAVKYLIIGGMSSGLALYGISMLYGLTGTIEISGISAAISSMDKFSLPFAVAMIALIAGYGFKISAVPFHMWAPDVYEGASTPVSMFLSTGSKKMVYNKPNTFF